jgi:hypothetical protein
MTPNALKLVVSGMLNVLFAPTPVANSPQDGASTSRGTRSGAAASSSSNNKKNKKRKRSSSPPLTTLSQQLRALETEKKDIAQRMASELEQLTFVKSTIDDQISAREDEIDREFSAELKLVDQEYAAIEAVGQEP